MAISDCQQLLPYAQAESARSGIPVWAYLALAYSESNCTGYGPSGGGIGFFGLSGSGPAGSYASNNQGYGSVPLQLFPSPQAAFAAQTSYLEQHAPQAVAAAKAGNKTGWVQGLIAAGYASPQDVQHGWTALALNAANNVPQGNPQGGPSQPVPGGGVSLGDYATNIIQNSGSGPLSAGIGQGVTSAATGAASAAAGAIGQGIKGFFGSDSFKNAAKTIGIGVLGGAILIAGITLLAGPRNVVNVAGKAGAALT